MSSNYKKKNVHKTIGMGVRGDKMSSGVVSVHTWSSEKNEREQEDKEDA